MKNNVYLQLNNECYIMRSFISIILSASILVAGLFISCNQIEQENKAPITTTGNVTDITEVSAIISGYANPTPEMGEITMGIIISTDENPSLDNGGVEIRAKEIDDDGKYTVIASALSPGITYYYKSFIQYGGVYRSGDVKSFTTLGIPIHVEIFTEDPTDVKVFSAVLNGKLLVESGRQYVKDICFYFGDGNSLEELKARGEKINAQLCDDGSFMCSLSELQDNTKYSFVAGAVVNKEEIYGKIVTFSTSEIGINTGEAMDIDMFSATITGSIDINEDKFLNIPVWFLYGTGSTLDQLKYSGEKINASLMDDGTISRRISSLNYNTQYYYVVGVLVNQKEYYGKVMSFKTYDINATVNTKEATSVDVFCATINGSLSVNNTNTLSKDVSFIYGHNDSLDGLIEHGSIVSTTLDIEGSFSVELYDLDYNSTYYYVACANVYDKMFYGSVASFVTKEFEEVIDLGVSVYWRGWNLGAETPFEDGNYYAWGETEPKTDYSLQSYKFYISGTSAYNSSVSKYNSDPEHGVVDDKMILDLEDDAAHVALGGKWRMPTKDEWGELVNNCDIKPMTIYGVKGCLVTSEIDGYKGTCFFLPVVNQYDGTQVKNRDAYFYWTSQRYNWYMATCKGGMFSQEAWAESDPHRYFGLAIRPVCEK